MGYAGAPPTPLKLGEAGGMKDMANLILALLIGIVTGFLAGILGSFAWEYLRLRFEPRTSKRDRKYQESVYGILSEVFQNHNRFSPEIGYVDSGFDFVVYDRSGEGQFAKPRAWLLLELKGQRIWSLGTIKIISQALRRLERSVQQQGATKGIIVIEPGLLGKGSVDHPFGPNPEGIEVVPYSDLKRTLERDKDLSPSKSGVRLTRLFQPTANRCG